MESSNKSIQALIEGNKRFLEGKLSFSKNREEFSAAETAKGQSPFATILACSDSRLSPEILFDQFLGDIFVCRSAGNHPVSHTIASIEYSVAQLGVPLVVIMGHTSCGAIGAAADNYINKGDYPSPSLGILIEDLKRGIESDSDFNLETLSSLMTEKNLEVSTKRLIDESDIVFNALKGSDLKIAHAIYELKTGHVRFLDQNEVDSQVKKLCQAREAK